MKYDNECHKDTMITVTINNIHSQPDVPSHFVPWDQTMETTTFTTRKRRNAVTLLICPAYLSIGDSKPFDYRGGM
jgi:hypothetical protein